MAKFSEYRSASLRLLSLYISGTKLKTTEIAIRLLSAILIGAIALMILAIAVFFVSVGVALQLARFMDPIWAFFIVGGFYVVLMALTWIFRRTVVVNPLSRILSRIILSNPIKLNDEDETDSQQ